MSYKLLGENFSIRYDSAEDAWILKDETNDKELLTIEKKGPIKGIRRYLSNGQTATIGGGTVNERIDRIELREPGNASAKEAGLWKKNLGVNPSTPSCIRFYLENVSPDDSPNGRIFVGIGTSLSETTDPPIYPGIYTQMFGDGDIELRNSNSAGSSAELRNSNSAGSSASHSSTSNTYANNLNWIEIEWNGSESIMRVYDGSTTHKVTSSSNYPDQILHTLFIRAFDNDSGTAINVDFDIVGMEWR